MEAARALERGLAICEAAGASLLLPRFRSGLGYACALAGRLPEGLSSLERGVEQGRAIRLMMMHALWTVWLSEGYLLAGRRADACNAAEAALTLARAHSERANEARALRLLGEIATRAEPTDVEQAESYYRQALALAEELGMRPLVAHCHLGLGALYQRVGRGEQAQPELMTAAEMYRAMDMT